MYKIYIFMQKKLIRILARALHEYVNFVHDSEKQYRSLSACWNTGVCTGTSRYCEFAFKPGVDFGRIFFDLFLKASDLRRYFKDIS